MGYLPFPTHSCTQGLHSLVYYSPISRSATQALSKYQNHFYVALCSPVYWQYLPSLKCFAKSSFLCNSHWQLPLCFIGTGELTVISSIQKICLKASITLPEFSIILNLTDSDQLLESFHFAIIRVINQSLVKN